MKPNCLNADRVCDQATHKLIDSKIRDISETCSHPAGMYLHIRKHIRSHYAVKEVIELPPKLLPELMRYLLGVEESITVLHDRLQKQYLEMHQTSSRWMVESAPLPKL
jgi:hypothetical protein